MTEELCRATPRLAFVTGLLVACAICPAQSQAPAVDALRIGGFGTLGVVHADAPPGWSYRRDISQVGSSRRTRVDTDTLLGLQLNDQATSQIELVGQLLLARTSPHANLSDSVQRAFVAWRPSPEWGGRAGRVNLDQYLMSDYRNVGFSYPTVRPPVDFYGLPASTLDGTDLTRSWDVGAAQWRLKGFAGRAHGGDLSRSGGYFLVDSIYGLVLSRQTDGLLLRASVSRVKIDRLTQGSQMFADGLRALAALPFPSIAAEADSLRQRLDYTTRPANYVALAVDDDWNDWQFTAEAWRIYGSLLSKYEDAYVRAARRFGPVTAFVGFSRIRGSAPHMSPPEWTATLAPALGDAAAQRLQGLGSLAANAIDSAAARQHTLSVGARWDVHPQMALKLQWDRVDTPRDGGRLWVNATGDNARSNVTTATLDFVF